MSAAVIHATEPASAQAQAAARRWRERKLAQYPRRVEDLIVELRDPRAPSEAELGELRRLCGIANMAVYAGPPAGAADREIVRQLGARLGLDRPLGNLLADEDGVSALEVAAAKAARGYIPYTDRRLLWHTDGYYNAPDEPIRAFILHCARPAAGGGENRLLDHEMAWLHLHDEDPAHVAALSAPDAMTVPANVEPGEAIRPARTGPVFCGAREALHMRYTARTRSIAWRDDEATRAATECLGRVLESSPFRFVLRLQAGQGLVCNNVLHDRSAFTDAPDAERLVYRARYADRVRPA